MDPNESPQTAGAEPGAGTDPAALVDQLARIGEWPPPELLERILAAGDAVVGPLCRLLGSRPHGWPDESPLIFAVSLLGDLKARDALPGLVSVARDYLNETSEEAARSLASLGTDGFDALLGLMQEPGVVGMHRMYIVEAAKRAAANDPALQARLAEVLRALFVQGVQEARQSRSFEDSLIECQAPDDRTGAGEELTDELEEEDDLDSEEPGGETLVLVDPVAQRRQEEAENEFLPDENLAFLADGLSDLADPLAKGMIQSAFEDDLIDETIISQGSFLESYRKGPAASREETGWLDDYRKRYREHQDDLATVARMGTLDFPSRSSYPTFEPDPPFTQARATPGEPFRHAGAKPGRNDPCWCGSGKKYKKCHMGKDGNY